MIIYEDALSGDEVCSDVYKTKELFNGHVLAVESQMVGINEEGDIAQEGDDVTAEVNQIVHAHNLTPFPLKFKEWQSTLKPFLGAVIKKLDEEGKDEEYKNSFKKAVMAFVGDVKAKMKKDKEAFEFFRGPKLADNALVIPMDWGEDESTPTLYYFKDALNIVKC
eukprot:CAMPEP_0117453556 /NCGR_PEP_ID=MMETSP0759-20121206/10289_1 /TAXON_ID=63605 /ORGANISM="Percolomonas cosmopolitus, Strain WS" /LENGTH=164 /DNA_ID=CAMNT_0005246601 /DNA_START=288 /DNA_END=782 /DNA_ORIENTATION=-